ncbi:MAG: sulfite exporter TauE/SafE family protein [Flavobacteriaceae bacterium]
MEFFGYLLAVLIGFFLGIFGGGGSLLAVPVFAYIFSLDEKVATAYSLFTVGISSIVGTIKQLSNIEWKVTLIFGIPSIIAVWLTRFFIIPNLPEIIFDNETFIITRRMLIFGIFTFLLFISSISMIYETNKNVKPINIKNFYVLIIIEGFIVGGLTGFVGAGGGFLIIPALVILIGLDIKKAIATSLIIIALKSTFGFFLGDVMVMNIDWDFLIYFTLLTTLGVLIGTYFGKSIDKLKLKKLFGIFIMVIAISILFIEFIK